MTRLTKNFDTGETYEVRFLPNINAQDESVTELLFTSKSNPMMIKKYFSYILRDNEATPVVYGTTIKRAIEQCIKGYIGTPDGRFITNYNMYDCDKFPNMFDKNGKLKSYFANKEKTTISLDIVEAKRNKLLEFTDMIEYPSRNPFDIRCGIVLCFNVSLMRGLYKSYDNLRWVNTEPLWKEGETESVLCLYKDVPALKNVVDSEVEYIKRALKYPNDTILVGEDAKLFYWEWMKSRHSNKTD
jgi:hypothetical protein